MLFDRCPADVIAYLLAHDDADAFNVDAWLDRTRDAMRTLDFVVFVPIEERDRIALPAHEDVEYRLAVHDQVRHLLVDDELGLETEVLAVHGNVPTRVGQVMARVGGAKGAKSRRPRKTP